MGKSTPEQRIQIWKNMCNVKFKALYSWNCARRVYHWGNAYSIVLALGTTGTVATWAIWQSYPITWGVILGIIQVLQIIKPFIPYVGNDKEYIDTSYKFGRLFLDFELLWKALNRNELEEKEVDLQLYDLKIRELDIEEKYPSVSPGWRKLIEKSCDQKEEYMKINYPNIEIETKMLVNKSEA